MGKTNFMKATPPRCLPSIWMTIIILLVTCSVTFSWVIQCSPGVQYWDSAMNTCLNCTRCSEVRPRGQIVIRPCELHRDALCGPMKDLYLDWSWLRKIHTPHRHRKHHHSMWRNAKDDNSVTVSDLEGSGDTKREDKGEIHSQKSDKLFIDEQKKKLMNDQDKESVNEKLVWDDTVASSNAETFELDWQAAVLAMAVCACILFFVVAAAYSVHHARQWKRLKDNFEADVEELSARLNLMIASGDNLEPNLAPINDSNYHNNQCVYLEQLLVNKETKMRSETNSNVYIEETNNQANNNMSVIPTVPSKDVD